MSEFYQQLCNMLIRPTRQTYHLYDLGNPLIGTFGKRQDFQILSRQNYKLKCSFYHPTSFINQYFLNSPTVIYLHSLNGSRLQFLSNVEPLLKMGFSIATLDFIGCGLSDGTYVTLGAHEKWDVLEVVKYIFKTYGQSDFMIWGRSMGAVAAIKFYSLLQQKMQNQQNNELASIRILGMVLDSPFSSLNQLAIQIAKTRINIPQIVIKVAFYVIQSSIQTKANFKTSELQLQNQVKKITSPTLIVTSKKDTLVPYEHSLLIYNNILFHDKQLMYIQTQHNNNREENDIQKIYEFLQEKRQPSTNSKKTYYTGNFEKKIENLQSKSLKKNYNLAFSQEKLNREYSQKNHSLYPKNNTFFMSHPAKHINQIQDGTPNHKVRQFSLQKIIFEVQNQQKETSQNYFQNPKQNHVYFSADRPRIFFVNEFHQSCANYHSVQKQQQKSPDLQGSIKFQQDRNKQKQFYHSLSYKNIECLKTVKKIKRLQLEVENNNQLKQRQEISRNHMNVITAKLKKKSKHNLTKSFLSNNLVEEKQCKPENQRTLRKQANVKSSTIIEFLNKNKSSINRSYKKNSNCEKPVTPPCYSNRQLMYSQNITKPFTPQFPLHSSMRINQITKQKQKSKEQIMKMYSVQPINQNSRGIRTTLNLKFPSGMNSNEQPTKKQAMIQPSSQKSQIHKPEFMSCKNMLSSQVINMRAENSISRSKKFVVSQRKIGNQHSEQTTMQFQ